MCFIDFDNSQLNIPLLIQAFSIYILIKMIDLCEGERMVLHSCQQLASPLKRDYKQNPSEHPNRWISLWEASKPMQPTYLLYEFPSITKVRVRVIDVVTSKILQSNVCYCWLRTMTVVQLRFSPLFYRSCRQIHRNTHIFPGIYCSANKYQWRFLGK